MSKLINLFLTVLLTGSSCQNSPPAIKRDELRMNINGNPNTLDPRKGGDYVASALHFMLFEGLIILNTDNSISPAQAESIEISDDKCVYTFHLRNSTWSDGSPVTARDFEKSWKDILKPDFPASNAHLLYPIKNAEAAKRGLVALDEVGIKAQDDKTLIIELEQPTPYFLQLISFCVFFPVNAPIDEAHPDWAYSAGKNFISNGPFVLKSWKHNNEIVLEKNEHYWNKKEVGLDAIRISIISDEMTAFKMYENNELDMINDTLSPIPADSLASMAKTDLLKICPVAGSTLCAFNNQRFPFNNVNIRKAFALAINREAIVKNITQLQETIATGAIPPILKKSERSFFKDHDAAYAKELFQKGLDELGIQASDLNGIHLSYYTSETYRKIVQALQQQWLEVLGVEIKLENMERRVLMEKLNKRDYEMALTIWIAQYSDQMNILERYKLKENSKNYAGWENPQFIRLLNESVNCRSDEERMQILEKAESIFMDEMPVAPIYHMNCSFLMKPYVKGLHVTPIGSNDYSKIRIEKKE